MGILDGTVPDKGIELRKVFSVINFIKKMKKRT
jgi:hypothetical protein